MNRQERRAADIKVREARASALADCRRKLTPFGFPDRMIRNFVASEGDDRALEVYSTGTESPESLHFDVYSLRALARTRTPVLQGLSEERLQTIISDGGVDPELARHISPERSAEPVIVCHVGAFQCLVDGNHRAVASALAGKLIPVVHLQREDWEPFLVPESAARWVKNLNGADTTASHT